MQAADVSIPLISGLGFYAASPRFPTGAKCLNPFDFRARFLHRSKTNREIACESQSL